MTKELKTRRDALREIVGTMAAAAALTELDVAELLAQIKKAPDLAKLGSIRTTDNAVKALKVLLAPKGQAARVFESEYGRKPALKPSVDAKSGRQVCTSYLGSVVACAELGCGLVVCNGLGMDVQLGGGRTLPGPGNVSEAGVYNKTQGCTEACTGKCTKIVVPPTSGFRVNPAWLQTVQGDPYIKGLMREYGVDTAEALETELAQALAERRAER